jgi:hypothetical protein
MRSSASLFGSKVAVWWRGDAFAVGHLEGQSPARVPAFAYSYGVVPGFERRLQRVVEFDRADGLAVNQDLELAPSEFKPKLSLIVPG